MDLVHIVNLKVTLHKRVALKGAESNMGTKKNKEAIDEIKKSLDFLTEEMSVVIKQQKMIMELVAEVKTLRIQNAEKDKRLDFLESRVQALEQYSSINCSGH
ncbi:unnamed protein product [Boreogadus saida]